MKIFDFFAFVCLFFISLLGYSQSNVLMLNGKSEPVFKYSVDYNEGMFYYKTEKREGKMVTKSVLLDDVFSYTDSLQIEKVIYKPSSEGELNVEQMRSYINGCVIAKEEYSPYLIMAGGFVVGTAGMFVTKNPIVSPLIPVAYCSGIALVKPSTDKLIFTHPEYAENPDLLYGYQRKARNKNVKYAILGSACGVVVGALVGTFTGYYN